MTKVEQGVIAMQYTNAFSVFDRGPSPQLIPGLGTARCACAVQSFKFAEKAGVRTHFCEQVADDTIHVLEFLAAEDETLSGYVHGKVLPLEWIWRARVFGSLWGRLERGEVTPEELGYPSGTKVTRGQKLPRLMTECTTKFEAIDRHLTDDEARELAGLSMAQWDEAFEMVTRAVRVTNDRYDSVGFECPDGKLEIGLTASGDLMLVDVFATPDENRVVRAGTDEMYCKDLLRDALKVLPWYDELKAAQEANPDDKSRWPEYPVLSDEFIQVVVQRYAEVAWRYAGVMPRK